MGGQRSQVVLPFPPAYTVRYILGMDSRPILLSIAGYDPSSGAGITADVKTAAALGCYAVTCITALTVQSTQGVFGVESMGPEVVRDTLVRLADDFEIAAVRIGMLGSAGVAEAVAGFLRQTTPKIVVLDPVIRSSSGVALIDSDGIGVLRRQLLPICDVATPNLAESGELAGMAIGMTSGSNCWETTAPQLRSLAAKLHEMGCRAVVITGGHLQEANDYLSIREGGGTTEQVFSGTHLDSRSTHGTGCAFATALACGLARGLPLPEAVRQAKEYVRQAISTAYRVGTGVGPMNHLFRLEAEK